MTSRLYAEVDTPALILDEAILRTNIRRMARFAAESGTVLRPHIKTHKSVAIARLQREAGAKGFTVAKLSEAEVLADAGLSEIRIAYELVDEGKIRRLLELSRRVEGISTLVDSVDGAHRLAEAGVRAGTVLDVLIEVDTGLARCGTPPGEPAVSLAANLREMPGLRFRGILTHAGHAYGAKDREEAGRIGRHEGEAMVRTARMIRQAGMAVKEVSVGSTPTVFHSARVQGVTEIRPGNYVFGDRMQLRLGAAGEKDCALYVLAGVVSRPAPDRLVLDAGSKALALDRGAHGMSGLDGHGAIVGHPGARIDRLSEEHGMVRIPADCPLSPGDRVLILPNHACTVANLFDRYHVQKGGRIRETWPVDARGCMT